MKNTESDYEYTEALVPISAISNLLHDNYIEVDSPDGWVEVSDYLEIGEFEEYVVTTPNGCRVSCNAGHKFETTCGWMSAEMLMMYQDTLKHHMHILTYDGTHQPAHVHLTGRTVPIVDIQVEHDNHRYYTDGLSSHNTGAGKSLFMCHLAAAALKAGQNVLYITMEMSEYKIAERIDANLLNRDIATLHDYDETEFVRDVTNLGKKTVGSLTIKEYPTASAHAGHFRALLNELKMKKQTQPDVIFIDYLNICSSSRLSSATSGMNSYGYIKAIAEELRGLAVEFDVPIWSATQTNRDGFGNTDVDLTNTSESIGLSATVDLQIAMIVTDELKELDQVLIKQLKNRYNDLNPSTFVVGCDRPKMRLYDVTDPTAGLQGAATANAMPAVGQTPFSSGTTSPAFSGFKV